MHIPALEAERLKESYFSDPDKRITLHAGEMLLDEGQRNERLYVILEGEVIGYRHYGEEERLLPVFRSGPGGFVGMHSFFSRKFVSSSRIVADTDTTLAFIDADTQPIAPETYGSMDEQFMPLIVWELAKRSFKMTLRAAEKEEAMSSLHRAEKMSTLGQLAAGISHEMNNAIGVLSRKTEFLETFIGDLLKQYFPTEYRFFKGGLESDSFITTAEMRKRIRKYQREFDCSREAAKLLARIAPTVEDARHLGEDRIRQLDKVGRYWEVGRDMHDMQVATRHAASIIKSVKVLGGGNFERGDGTDLRETLDEAMALLKSSLRKVQVETNLAPMRPIFGNGTELVQIWVNLLKNACDAMDNAGTEAPTLVVKSVQYKHKVQVSITDNGPGVPEVLQEKIFQPDFTTKKSGLSFGLGLGLAIVQRLVESYGGEIVLKSRPGKTTFKVKLPIRNAYGKN